MKVSSVEPRADKSWIWSVACSLEGPVVENLELVFPSIFCSIARRGDARLRSFDTNVVPGDSFVENLCPNIGERLLRSAWMS